MRNALLAEPMTTITPLLTPNESRMFGAKVLKAADSNSSKLFSSMRRTKGKAPPILKASFRVIFACSSPTPYTTSSARSAVVISSCRSSSRARNAPASGSAVRSPADSLVVTAR